MVIDYQNVDVLQEETTILKNITFQAEQNEFIFLTGLVGSGKSTFLRSLYADTTLTGVKANVLGIDLLTLKPKYTPLLRKQLGIVFQDFQLLPDRTVYKNLSFVLRATGWNESDKIKQRIHEVLKQVDLTDKIDKYPHEMSGGEQQRISIARAILNTPKIIIADEPTGNLDEAASMQIIKIMKGICAQGTTVIMTTHNLALLGTVPGSHHYTCVDSGLVRRY